MGIVYPFEKAVLYMVINDYKENLKKSVDIMLCDEINTLESAVFDYIAYDFSSVLQDCLTAALCEAGKRFVNNTLSNN